MSAHKIWVPPNVEYPAHTHPSPHVIVVIEGGGYGKIQEGECQDRFEIQAGSVFHVPANIVHQVGADTRGLIMLAISVGAKALTDPNRLQVVQ